MSNLKKYLAEAFGTCCLVFFACGAAVISGDYFATAAAFGLVLIAVAYAVGHISGAHINPAVSLAFFLRKELSLKDFIGYICSQFAGGIVGSLLLGIFVRDFKLLGGNEISRALANHDTWELDAWSYIGAFLIEVVLTCLFVLAILNATDKRYHSGKIAGPVIGLALTLVHLVGMGFTGTSVNPARSFAPAVLQAIAGDTTSLSQVWIWLIAPMAGAAAAAFLYTFITGKVEEKKAAKAEASEPKAEEAKEAEVKEEEKAE